MEQLVRTVAAMDIQGGDDATVLSADHEQLLIEVWAAFYNHAITMIGFIAFGLFMGDFARTTDVLSQPSAWIPIAGLGILTAISLPLYYVALRRMDVWKLRMFMLAAPVLTAVVEWPLWGIQLSRLQWLGAAIILVGLAVLIRMEWRLTARGNGARATTTSAIAGQAVSNAAEPTDCSSAAGQHPTKDSIA